MAGDYESPGGAFVNAMEDHLMKQAAQKHLQLMDSLAQKREDRLTQAELDAAQERRDALKEHAQQVEDQLKEKKTVDLQKRVEGMVPGDIPDAQMLKQADELGIGGQNFPKPAQSMPGVAAVPMGAPVRLTPPGQAPIQTSVPNPETAKPGIQSPSDPSVRPFIGSRVEREKATQEGKIKAISDQMAGLDPMSPEFKRLAVQYEMTAGKPIPAAMMATKGGTGDGEAIARVDPKRQVVQRLVDGQWVDTKGDMPKGTHFLQEPTPKDDSAQKDRESNHVDQVRSHAHDKIDADIAKPLKTQIASVDSLITALNQNTNISDAVIAPMVLKATVSGTGSGFRMTQPEINSVLKGTRTSWDSLQVAINKWTGDGPLILTDDQKTGMRALAKAIRKKAVAQYKKVVDADDALDNATSVEQINKIHTKLRKDSVPDDDDDASTTVPVVGGMFNGGKVLKVTPITPGAK